MRCKGWIGCTLAMGLLAGAAAAQDDATDMTPPDLGVPRGERAVRTCPDREPRPAWTEALDGWEVERARLLTAIHELRAFETILGSGDCSCAVKAPPWDAAEAEYLDTYAALDIQAVREARVALDATARGLRPEVRRICLAQSNW